MIYKSNNKDVLFLNIDNIDNVKWVEKINFATLFKYNMFNNASILAQSSDLV